MRLINLYFVYQCLCELRIRVPETQSAFRRCARRNAFRSHARPQSRSFAPQHPTLRPSPSLHPASLSLSAMISRYFIEPLPFSLPDEFPTQHNLWVNVVDLNDLLARVRCRKTLCP